MKKSEIVVGKSYTDSKGGVRKVVGEGSQFAANPGQAQQDNVRYLLVAKKRGPHLVGQEYNSTRDNFAFWAKSEHVETAAVAAAQEPPQAQAA